MTHVVISLDDQPDGTVNVITATFPALMGEAVEKTKATELAEFLSHAIDIWRETDGMTKDQAIAYVSRLNAAARSTSEQFKPTIN